MYRVNVADASVRSDLLNQSYNLEDHANFKTVFLSRDLTHIQRHEQRASTTTRRNQVVGTQ